LACLGLFVGAASAAARKPVVVSLSVAPTSLPSSGGVVTLSGRVRNAVSCTVIGFGPWPVSVRCSSGRIFLRRAIPADSDSVPEIHQLYVEAHNGHKHTRSQDVEVEVQPKVAAAPPVRGLDACVAGPGCDYGTAYDSFQNWGNVAPDGLGDCTFAAAANWEQIVLGVNADPTVIGYEFAQAGGTEQGGLAQNSLWTYWRKYGIAGVYLTGLHRYTTEQADVENSVRDYAAVIAELDFTANDGFGEYTVAASTHDVVVDGFTPGGPLVVTWGETLQITWEQWNNDVVGMWGIGAS
jgi:hypothetical protein